MKSISVGALRQNPARALAEVEGGESYIITRHNREIGRLVPPERAAVVTSEQFQQLISATPLERDWSAELADARGDLDGGDPWATSA